MASVLLGCSGYGIFKWFYFLLFVDLHTFEYTMPPFNTGGGANFAQIRSNSCKPKIIKHVYLNHSCSINPLEAQNPQHSPHRWRRSTAWGVIVGASMVPLHMHMHDNETKSATETEIKSPK